ncbi:MAPK-interacting and spindle-stabilizing protein-like [Haliaeetus albicilla]|uniref:MAPK-interacting and spindle-stabilizing protein-like n=1 Tax=Haliaeetus albicilla TaxID=8969 RepID=UPI0037E7A753
MENNQGRSTVECGCLGSEPEPSSVSPAEASQVPRTQPGSPPPGVSCPSPETTALQPRGLLRGEIEDHPPPPYPLGIPSRLRWASLPHRSPLRHRASLHPPGHHPYGTGHPRGTGHPGHPCIPDPPPRGPEHPRLPRPLPAGTGAAAGTAGSGRKRGHGPQPPPFLKGPGGSGATAAAGPKPRDKRGGDAPAPATHRVQAGRHRQGGDRAPLPGAIRARRRTPEHRGPAARPLCSGAAAGPEGILDPGTAPRMPRRAQPAVPGVCPVCPVFPVPAPAPRCSALHSRPSAQRPLAAPLGTSSRFPPLLSPHDVPRGLTPPPSAPRTTGRGGGGGKRKRGPTRGPGPGPGP